MWTAQFFGTTLALSATPVVVLSGLWLAHHLASGPAMLGIALCLLGAAVVAVIWVRDVGLLAETVRQAALENPTALSLAASAPRLQSIERVTRNIERLSRTLASRSVMVGRLLAANEAIVERLPDPLLVLSADHGVRRANAAARAAFGADMSAVLRHPDLRAAIERAFETRGTDTTELALPVPVPREVSASVLFMDPPLADGGHAIVVLSDRSRERAVERMRADFIANASHELRTPLASLIGFIATLQGPARDDEPARDRFLAIMAEQSERMNRLIDDLMSLSRIELTEHQPPADHVWLPAVIERVLDGFEPRLVARRVQLTLNIMPQAPKMVADADQMFQVITNLVDNALKYGREDGLLRISLNAASPGDRWPTRPGLVLSVRDDGRGIAREHIPRLTERFYRVDKARGRSRTDIAGTGLGLAIIKHIVNRHRGQLVIESEPGAGSTFSIWLPLFPDKQEVTS